MHNFSLDFNILVLIRITAAIVFGFGIGLERELTNKYAGLRTHILVCLGSCIFTILSIYAFPMAVDQSHPQAYGDPARIAAQILTGIGFIGGGTVLRHGSSVFGLTTAATLWVSASIGMACGAGMLSLGLITALASIAVLVGIRSFEKNILPGNIKSLKRLKITAQCSSENSEKIHGYIVENFERIHEISRKHEEENGLTQITTIIDVSGKKQIKDLYKKFENLNGLEAILIQETDE